MEVTICVRLHGLILSTKSYQTDQINDEWIREERNDVSERSKTTTWVLNLQSRRGLRHLRLSGTVLKQILYKYLRTFGATFNQLTF